jgi:hypothetical protein
MPLSARMLELSALEVLLAIAKTGSVSASGRELGLTQQAVSVRLHGAPDAAPMSNLANGG